jgi:hypothetical protein
MNEISVREITARETHVSKAPVNKTRASKTQAGETATARPRRVFKRHIYAQKYKLWIARMKYARGEMEYNELLETANALIDLIRARRDRRLGNAKRYRLKLCAADLIADLL